MGRFRLRMAVVAVVVGLLAATTVGTASAQSWHGDGGTGYLALGDSVPFGYDPLLVRPGVSPQAFVGYPELVAHADGDLRLANAACPGETSTSLITGTRPDNGCQDYRQYIGALHVSYAGSQLSFAEHYLSTHHAVSLITMMIGANDLFVLQKQCADDPTCIAAGLPATLATVGANLATIYTGLRRVGFRGTLLAVTYYSLDYGDASGTAIIAALDGVVAGVTRSFGGSVANGFGQLQRAAAPFGGDSCAAGLLIRLSATSCDVHPTRAGAALLADAVRDAIHRSHP